MTVNLHDLAHEYAAPIDPSLPRAAAEWSAWTLRLLCDEIDCAPMQLEVWPFGSTSHRTHLSSSDIDLAITPKQCRVGHVPRADPSATPTCDMFALREFLIPRLQKRLGADCVMCDEKSITVSPDRGRHLIDYVVLIPQNWEYDRCPHCGEARCAEGYEIRSFAEQDCAIATWPVQHREHVLQLDDRTKGWFSSRIRAIKGLVRHGMKDLLDAAILPSVLVESLVASVTDRCYTSNRSCPFADVRRILEALAELLNNRGHACSIRELSGMRDLFDAGQTWSVNLTREAIQRLSQRIHR